MPMLRFKRWRYLTNLAPYTAYGPSGRTYHCGPATQGLVEVRNRADVEALLNPPGMQELLFEVAWEHYGVRFDAAGQEVVSPTSMEATIACATEGLTLPPPTLRTISGPMGKKGRPKG